MSFHQIQLSIEVLSRIRMIEIIKSLDFHLFKPFLFQKFFQMQQVSHQSVYVYKFHQENLVCKLSLKHLHLEDQFLQRDLPELHGQSILFIIHVKKNMIFINPTLESCHWQESTVLCQLGVHLQYHQHILSHLGIL